MIVKNKEELEILREAGKRLREVLDELEKAVKPGVSTCELDELARNLIKKQGAEPSFLNYKPHGAKRPYPAAICTSVNEEVVHGIPNENPRILKEGDIVTLDAGLWFKGICVDSARTVAIGTVSDLVKNLISVAREARDAQISNAKAGAKVADLGKASEQVIKKAGFYYPEILGGHGVGKEVHEEPFIPNFYSPEFKYKFKEGEVLALEPIVIAGTGLVKLLDDGYTYVSKDGSLSAQFEHTIVILKTGAEIVT